MIDAEPNDATPFLPERHSLAALREAAAGCRGCHLWRRATQTVFGEGLKRSRLMLIGEIPGDREDREGRPFVGPAGRELDGALEAAGIDRSEVYVTNAGKSWRSCGRRARADRRDGGQGAVRREVHPARRAWPRPRLRPRPGAIHGMSGRGAGRALLNDQRMRPWRAPRPSA
jgi:DNA polymerase